MNDRVRRAAVAGMFYPGDAQTLRRDIAMYLKAATPTLNQRLVAALVPHAGYMYSGAVAAFAYKLLAQQPAPRRVILMGPSHRAWFRGVALADVEAFHTPLGDHPVDVQRVAQFVASSPLFMAEAAPHAPEHCLEVQYPFLQSIWPGVPTVPMLFGDVDALSVGEALQQLLEADEFILVSSDLSHFYPNEAAHRLDHQFLDALLAGDARGIASGEACGQAPALALSVVARQRGWKPHLLDYRTSGDVTGDRSRVVGYAAVAYVEEA